MIAIVNVRVVLMTPLCPADDPGAGRRSDSGVRTVRVLLADDERLLADTVADGLRKLSMAVDVCYDGDAALERLGVNQYAVAVLDRDMPGRTGDEVCQWIVQSELGTRPPPGFAPVLDEHGVVLDTPRHQAFRDGELLDLTPKEFAVLSVLMRSSGQVVSAEALLEQAWDEHADPFTNAMRVAVMTLRRKLGDPPLIHTVPRVGYRFGG